MHKAAPNYALVLVTWSIVTITFSGPVVCQSSPEAANELVRRTVQNEVKSNADGGKFMFCDHKQTPHGDETKLLVETQQATAGLVIARNGTPLSPPDRQSELAREQRYVNDAGELRRKQDREQEDRTHTIAILKALPDAFLYERAGTEPGTNGVGKTGDELVRLNFHPNPKYAPPSRVEQVLTGLQGYLLIDENQHRIAKIDGTLFRDVDFGWGILGRLYRGGRFIVEQGDEGDGQWELTHMRLQIDGKVLLIKKLVMQSDETFTGFHRVAPNLTFADGLRLLQNEETNINHHAVEASSK